MRVAQAALDAGVRSEGAFAALQQAGFRGRPQAQAAKVGGAGGAGGASASLGGALEGEGWEGRIALVQCGGAKGPQRACVRMAASS